MVDVPLRVPLWRLARSLHRRVAEIIQIIALYLGIAVMVSAVTIMTMPGLRVQASTLHTAWLAALSPTTTRTDLEDVAEAGQGGLSMGDVYAQPTPGEFHQALNARPSSALFRAAGVSRDQAEALRRYIARKYRVAYDAAGVVVHTAFATADKYKLDPLLILAVVAIESRYNPFAESSVGAQGLMQVMPRVHKDKFEVFGEGDSDGLALDPIVNMHVGSQILRDCVQRRGSLAGGLSCYVGATGPSDGGYGAKVLAERRRLALAADLPLER